MSGTIGGRWRASRAAPVARPRLPPTAAIGEQGWYELTAPPSPFDSSSPPASVLIDGDTSALVGAGSGSDDTWVYDFGADTYTPDDPAPSVSCYSGALIGTKSLFVDATAARWWTAGTWSTGASHGVGSSPGVARASAGGLLYVLFTPFDFLSYDPASNTWTTLSDPATAGVSDVNVDNALVEGFPDNLYLFTTTATGGYEISTDTWVPTFGAVRPDPIQGSAYGMIGDSVYFAGGYDYTGGLHAVDNLDIYSVSDDSWSSGPAMSDGTSNSVAGITGLVHDGALYVWGYNGSPGFELWARKYVP